MTDHRLEEIARLTGLGVATVERVVYAYGSADGEDLDQWLVTAPVADLAEWVTIMVELEARGKRRRL